MGGRVRRRNWNNGDGVRRRMHHRLAPHSGDGNRRRRRRGDDGNWDHMVTAATPNAPSSRTVATATSMKAKSATTATNAQWRRVATPYCQLAEPYCGDGNVDRGEECDDGNWDNGDGCRRRLHHRALLWRWQRRRRRRVRRRELGQWRRLATPAAPSRPYCGDGNVDEEWKSATTGTTPTVTAATPCVCVSSP
jgi:cysteine-rich repeat protein